MSRPLIYAANWKMHHAPAAARAFMARFLAVTEPVPERAPLVLSARRLPGRRSRRRRLARPDIRVGAQNVHWEPKGAFTGEVSIPMVQEAGARVILIGHSERRHLFGETDEQVARKSVAVLKAGLQPLACLGETLAEREGGRTEHVILRQLEPLLDKVPPADWQRMVLAYEPVWAIGTGRNATPDDAAQVTSSSGSRYRAGVCLAGSRSSTAGASTPETCWRCWHGPSSTAYWSAARAWMRTGGRSWWGWDDGRADVYRAGGRDQSRVTLSAAKGA